MHLLGVARVGPGLALHPRDGLIVKGSDRLGVPWREGAAGQHCLRAALLEGRVVEEPVGTDHERAARYLEDLMFIQPFEIDFHRMLAASAEALGQHDVVIREVRVLMTDPGTNPLESG